MAEGKAGGERHNPLLSNEIFRTLDRRMLDGAAREGFWLTSDPNQILFSQGDDCNYMLMVVAGSVTLSFASDRGREVIVSEAGPGDILGEVELVLNCRRLTNGLASARTRLFALRRATFTRLLQDCNFSRALLEAVCLRWCRLAHFAEITALHTLEQRLASLLLDLCRGDGRSAEGTLVIERPMSQTRMAQLINASRPKVNTQLHAWRREGLIGLERGRIVVRNGAALRNIAAQG